MSVNRITRQFDLKNSDSVILVYGQVNDTFITEDLRLHNIDGIEKVLALFLHAHGYDQVIFYSPERQLYTYDGVSFIHCFPPDKGPQTEVVAATVAGGGGDTITRDRRPLGAKKYLRPRSVPGSARNASAMDHAGREPVWNEREGFISVVRGGSDTAVVEIIRAVMHRTDGKSAVILSQFDNPHGNSEVQRLLDPQISRFQRRNLDNKLFIITNAVDHEKLKEVVDRIPALNSILKMQDAEKGLDSLIHIGYPQQDETRAVIHRARILNQKEVDWLQIDRIARALDLQRNSLKKWERMLREMTTIDVASLNRQKVLSEPLSAEEEPPFTKLDALVGLTNIKQALRRYVRQLQDVRRNSPDDRPLMHILLKGNPGTGKTTIARLIAAILRDEGLLERGHLVEVDQARLVAGYVGQTAIATDNCCREALGGVLFIDEAYALMPRKERNSSAGGGPNFGQEAIDTLIKRMSDWQERFCVILAGYPEEMTDLLKANPGFKGRIGLTLTIEDYKPEELFRIFNGKVEKLGHALTEGFSQAMLNVFTGIYKKRKKKFDNARTVEQLFGSINGLRLERCERQDLDPFQTTFQIEDIPEEYVGYVRESPPEGDAMIRLNEMIGLKKAKEQIRRQIAAVLSDLQAPGLTEGRRLHLVLKGNPGTGKTTLARLVGEIYQHHQILRDNVFVEAGRDDLVGQYVGETAQKVAAKVEEAMGGILFIDEAYSLVNGDNDTYGKEAINILLKKMDDHRKDLCVIIAGYPDRLRDFLKSNPGLSRRFPTSIELEDFDAAQLFAIFQMAIGKKAITLEEGLEEKIKQIIRQMYHRRDEHFGNAGDIENLIQHMIEGYSDRCLEQKLPLRTTPVILADLPESACSLLPANNNEEVIEEAMKELDALIGLAPIKKHVKELIAAYKHQQRRRIRFLDDTGKDHNYNMLFMGNPGTGKTTVARLMGKIFRALDILNKGEVFAVTRDNLIGRYQGETAPKTKELLKNAFDNILFIDEAYSLFLDPSDSVGREAVNTLVPMMTDHRDRLVVIAAGYPKELQYLMRANSGLASRFPKENQIIFPDYNGKEMAEIFKHLLKKRKYDLQEGLDKDLEDHLSYYKAQRGHEFGNARDVETWLNNIVLPRHRERVALLETTDALFSTIIREDLPPREELMAVSEDKQETGKPNTDFSPSREKKEQAQSASAIYKAGGDVLVTGDKNITNNYITEQPKEPDQELTSLPEPEGQVFGRDEVVRELFHKLFDLGGAGRLVLYGMGGIGKTRTVVHLINSYKNTFSHIIWLETKTNLQKTFIENNTLLTRLAIDFTEKDDDVTRFEKVKSKILGLRNEVLLVIDGLPAEAAEELKGLSLANCKIIITAREQLPGIKAVKLEPLSAPSALQLFRSFYPAETSDELINQLLQPVSYHPLAVEILAKILQTNPNMTFDRLLEQIDGLFIKRGRIDLTYSDGGKADDEIIEIFKTLFSLVDLEEEEVRLLLYFSVLPDHPVPRPILYKLFQLDDNDKRDHFNQIVVSLQQKGFISGDAAGLFCHQIIQQVCRNQRIPSLENCKPLFITLGLELGDEIDSSMLEKGAFDLITDYLHLLETFVTHFDQTDLFDHRVFINLSQLYRLNGQFAKSVEVSLNEKTALEPMKERFPFWYVIINTNIGVTKINMAAYEDAEELFKESIDFIETLDLKEYESRTALENALITAYSQLGNLQMRLGKNDIDQAVSCFEKALAVANECEAPTPLAMTILKEGLALAQIEQEDYKQAIRNLHDAQKLLTDEVGLEQDALVINLLDVALATAYAGERNFTSARFYSYRATENIRKYLPEDDLQCCRIYYTAASIDLQEGLEKRNKGDEPYLHLFQESAIFFEKTIKIAGSHRGPDHEDMFLMYSNYALALKYSDREEAAYEAQLKSLAICRKIPVKHLLVMAVFFRTIFFFGDHLEGKEAEEYLAYCLDMLPKKPEHYLDIAYINYILGDFLYRNDREREAIAALLKALDWVHKNFVKDKEHPHNDSPMEVICMQAIAECYSRLREHRNAIKWQQDAVEICERNMEKDDIELADPYVVLAKIYLAAANDEQVDSEAMEYYALSLEYKTRVEKLDERSLQNNPQLDDSGKLYLVLTKNEKGEAKKELVIIPYRYYTQFEADYVANTLSDMSKYGYVLPEVKGLKRDKVIDHYVEIYGAMTDRSTKIN